MADIKLESQEADLLSQDSLLRSISPLQEHKSASGVNFKCHDRLRLLIYLHDDPTHS